MATPSYPDPSFPNSGDPNWAYPNPSYNLPSSAPIVRPGTVQGAFLIYLISAAISLLSIILVMTSDVWDQAIAASGANTSGLNVDALITTAKTITIVIGVILLALYLFFAFKMRAGRNWARIVLTVLSALSILSSFSASASVTVNNQTFSSSTSQILGYVGAVLAAVAIVLMYMGPSNQFFASMKGRNQ